MIPDSLSIIHSSGSLLFSMLDRTSVARWLCHIGPFGQPSVTGQGYHGKFVLERRGLLIMTLLRAEKAVPLYQCASRMILCINLTTV
jgi:hypothetical protein